MKKSIVLLALAASLATAGAQTIISDNFNNAGTAFSNFTVQAGGSADGFSYSSTAGVAGIAPGRVDAVGAANHTDSVYYSGTGAAITWSAGTTYSSSLFFLPGTVSVDIAQVTTGFLRSTGSNFAGGGSGVWGQLRNDGGGTYIRLYQQNTLVGNSSTFTLSNTLWYELATTMNLSNATTGDLGVSLYSRGADGTGSRTLVQSFTNAGTTIGNSGFSATTLYGAFGGGNNSGSNIAAFDNFSVNAIPEPTTWVLLAGSLTTLMVFRRRRAS